MAEQPSPCRSLCLLAVALLINAAASDAYTNYTVGGEAGWFFDASSNKTSADYSAWTANKTFNLGDYLIFNTNTNQTVIQTYNKTTYDSCNTDNASDTDTFQYDGGSEQFGATMTIFVPLTQQGTQYYFSDANDGEQCLHSMAFEIKVNRGLGLPPSLNQPPPPPADGGQLPPPQLPPTTDVTATPNGGVKASGRLCLFAFMILGIVRFSFLA